MAAQAASHHARSGSDPAPAYARHRPEHTLLYQIVAQHYPAFRAQRAAEERPLPTFVQREFEAYHIETCRHCGGTVKIIASIEDPEVIARILEHLERNAVPELTDHAPRAPPHGDLL